MVVALRMQRYGQRHLPFWRIVAADCRRKRDGKFLEKLGIYVPRPEFAGGNKLLRINKERVKYWLSVGAQPSDTVARLLGFADVLPPVPVKRWVDADKVKEFDEKRKQELRAARREKKKLKQEFAAALKEHGEKPRPGA